jgi:hypothetical protein
VSGGIAVGAGAISGDGYELILSDNTSAYGHFTAVLCLTGGGQRLPHPAFINLDFRGSFH